MTDNNTLPPQQDEDLAQNSPLDANIVDHDLDQEDTPMVEPETQDQVCSEPDTEPKDEPEPVDDTTELHTAARNIDLPHMRKIFESNMPMNINAKTSENGHTPLWDLVSAAVEWDEIHEDAVTCLKLLISHGADVNAQANHGATPLHRCASSWCQDTSVEIAQVLLDHGADPNANKTIKVAESTPETENVPLHDHKNNNHGEEEDDGCECGLHIGTLLKAASKSTTGGQTLDLNPSKPKSNSQAHEPLVTPVHLAVGRNANLPMLKLLLANGATPSISINDPDAGTPLHLAVAAGNETKYLEIITLLLSQLGPNASVILSTANNKGYLPIHLAAESYSYSSNSDSKSHEIITALLEAGSPVDTPLPDSHPRENRRGLTPLLLVAQNSQLPSNSSQEGWNPPLKTITSLISKGADPTIQAFQSQSALLFSVLSRNLPLLKYLSSLPGIDIKSISAATEITKPLYAACIAADPALIKFLVTEANCPVDETDSEGYTGLIHAAGYAKDRSQAAETIRVLVEDLGADIEAAIYDGRRAIHFAAFKGQVECVRELVRLGCDIAAVDENGWTPLHFAGRYHYPDVIKVLLDDDEGKGKGLIGQVVKGGPQPKMRDGTEIDIVGFNAADLARTVRKGGETVGVLLERGEALGERTRDLTDEDLWEDKGGCTIM